MPGKKEKVVLTEEQLDVEIEKAKLRLKALTSLWQQRKAEAEASRAEEEELREKANKLEEAFQEAKRERFDIVADFTRQYKAIEDDLIARTTLLESTIADLADQRELSKLALEETRKEREHQIAMKDRDCEEQDRKMEEMEEEFKRMQDEMKEKMTRTVEKKSQEHGRDIEEDSTDENAENS